jgi:hypothetical protein
VRSKETHSPPAPTRVLDDEIHQVARRFDFNEILCPSCGATGNDDGRAICANCSGTKRLWVNGPVTLSDAGIRRLSNKTEG